MAARYVPSQGLDLRIAAKFGPPAITRALDMLQDAARRNAPPVKTWVTVRDERVRPTHVESDGQAVPANLRFRVPSVNGLGVDLARYPRDPALPEANRVACRCDAPEVDHPLRDSIHKGDVVVVGTRVSGEVETRYPRAAESEYGGDGDEPAHFMTNALREVAARLRSGQSR